MHVVPSIILLGSRDQTPQVYANIAWVLDNLLGAVEYIPSSQLTQIFPILAKLLHVAEREATSYSASAVARAAEKFNEKIVQDVINTQGLVESLVRLLE